MRSARRSLSDVHIARFVQFGVNEKMRLLNNSGFPIRQGAASAAEANRVVSTRMGASTGYLPESLGTSITLYRGQATFAANRTLRVNGNFIDADKLVLATGSRPKRPALEVPYWTSDDIFKIRQMPKSITIVGGGYIACELGHFFQGVGVDTLLAARRDQLLDREDNETRAVFMKGFATRVPVTFQLDNCGRHARRFAFSHQDRLRLWHPVVPTDNQTWRSYAYAITKG